MFKNLFGGKKEEKKPVPQQQNAVGDDEIKREKAKVEVQKQVQKLDDGIDKYTKRLEILDKGVKEDLANKRKGQAKTKIMEMNQLKKFLITMENKKNVFVKMKIQLEMANDDIEAAEVFKTANIALKDYEKITENLQDQMEEFKDFQSQSEQTNNLWGEMAQGGTDQDEIDDELDRYMQEANEEEANKVGNDMANIPKADVQKVQQKQQVQQQPQQDIKQSNFQNALDEMLN